MSEVVNYISARSGEIIANINEQLSFAEIKNSDLPAGIIIIGGGSHLNGFIELLEQTTKMKVNRGSYPIGLQMEGNTPSDIDIIPAVSIANIAAKMIPNTENCLRRVMPELPKEPVNGTDQGDKKNDKKKHSEDKKSQNSKMAKLFTRVKTIFDEDENETEE